MKLLIHDQVDIELSAEEAQAVLGVLGVLRQRRSPSPALVEAYTRYKERLQLSPSGEITIDAQMPDTWDPPVASDLATRVCEAAIEAFTTGLRGPSYTIAEGNFYDALDAYVNAVGKQPCAGVERCDKNPPVERTHSLAYTQYGEECAYCGRKPAV